MATYEQQIKVSAVISPAERALQKLSDQLDRLQKAAQKILKPAPLRLDTRNAERQIAGLQRQIAGISSVQTVRVRVIREVEDRYLGGSGSTSGGGMGMALAGAAVGAGLASRRQRALPPAGASTASVAGLLSAETTRTLRGVQNYVETTGKTVEALAKSGDAVITGGRRLVQVELQMRQLELQLSKAGTARNIPTRVRDITPQRITSYQPNAYRFPAQQPADNAFYDRWRYRQTDRGPGSFFMGTQPVRTNGLGRQLSEFHIARESGKGSLTELQAELKKFFLTAEEGVITFSGLTPRLNKIYQRQLEAMKLPYQVDSATGFRMQLPLRSQLTTARSAGPFVPPMAGPMAPRTLLERYQAGSIGLLGSRGGGGGRIPPGGGGGGGLLPPAGGLPPQATPATPAASAKGATYDRDAKAAAGLASTLGNLATAYFSVQAAAIAYQRIAAPALERDSALRAIRANTEQFGEYGQAMTAVQSQVQKLGISQTEAAQGFVAAYNALRPLGIQLETINQIQTAFIASSRLSGASAENAAAGWRQLVQALGKGRLNGDELVSVMENAPSVAQAIAKELGVSVGKLKELGEEGSLTADKIVAALLKLRDPALNKLDVVLQGPAQQLKNLSNLMQDLAVELGRVFGPALGSELKSISTAVQGLVGWMKTLTPEFGKTVVEAVKLVAQLFLVSKAIKAVQATAGVVAFLRTLAATQVAVGTTAGSATLATNALAASLARLAAFGAITIAIKVAIDGLVELQRLNGEVDKLQGKNAKGAAAAFTGASEETVTRAQSVQRGLLVGYRSKLADFERQRDQMQVGNPGVALLMEKNAKVLRERIKFAEAVLKLDASDYKSQAELNRLKEEQRQKEIKALQQGVPVPDADPGKDKKEEVRRGVIGGLTGGGQADASRGRSTGPHLHAQLVRGNNLESLVDAALDFGGGRTASSFGLGRGAAAHGYPGRDFYTPQGTPFTLRPGWTGQDLGIQGALGRGMRISGPGGVFELGHLQGVKTGDLNGKGAAGDLLDAQQDALNAAIEFQQKQEEQLATSKQLLAVAQQDLLISQTRDPLKRAELEGEKAQLEIKQKYAELQTNALSAEELINLQLAEKAELERASNEAMGNYIKALYEALGVAELLSSEVEKFGPKAFGGAGGADGYAPGMPNLNPGSGTGGKERLQGEYDRVKAELEKLNDPVNQIVAGAEAIGTAFSESFKGLISGAMTAQEALANFFQRTADHFLDMASQMIAKYLEMKLIGLAMNFLGSAATGSAASGGYTFGGGGSGSSMFMPGAPSFFADGGFVTGPTKAVVGEGAQPEYIIPENKMSGAMARYNSGARGEAVINGADPTGAGGGAADGSPVKFDISYSAVRIDNIDYVNTRQLQESTALAAKQGAAMGEARALRKLQMSPGARRKVGL